MIREYIHDPLIVTVSSVTTKASGIGAAVGGSAYVFGFTSEEWVAMSAVGGFLVAAASFAVSWYYRHQEFKRGARDE